MGRYFEYDNRTDKLVEMELHWEGKLKSISVPPRCRYQLSQEGGVDRVVLVEDGYVREATWSGGLSYADYCEMQR